MTRALARSPRRALVGSAVTSVVTVIILLLVLAAGVGRWFSLSSLYFFKAKAQFAGSVLLFAPLLLQQHPHRSFGPANQITLVRGMLVALLGGFVGESISEMAAFTIVGIGLAALILDGVDGKLARRSGMTSEFGARFDMETDAVLVLLFSILAWQMDKAGSWVILSGLLRYLFVAAGWLLPWMRAALPPSQRRQTVCVIQIAVMLAVLLPFVNPPLSDALAALTLAVLLASFLVDVRWLAKHSS